MDGWATPPVREYFKDIIAQNKSYSAQIHQIDLQSLYTPKSYLDLKENRRIVEQLQTTLDIETKQESELHEILERFKTRINRLD